MSKVRPFISLAPQLKVQFFDIAANLSDNQFKGEYYGKQHHEDDTEDVIRRAQDIGCDRMLFASGYLQDAKISYELSKMSEKFYTTVGVHPCRANEVEKDSDLKTYYDKMEAIIQEFGSKVIAIGECGLDYDRFDYSDKETQLSVFPMHFDLAEKYKLPMYLHSRNCKEDFLRIVKENRHRFSTGVVHSYTGDLEELEALLDMGLYIGVNGCSFKTQENLEVVKKIPLNRIMLETDCPYCEIRNTHAGMKFVKSKTVGAKKKEKQEKGFQIKGRNEPENIVQKSQNRQVLQVVAGVLGKSEEEVAQQAYENSLKCFNLQA